MRTFVVRRMKSSNSKKSRGGYPQTASSPNDTRSAPRVLACSTAVVVLTGYGSIATALEAIRLGATHYLTKPTDADRILEAFARGLESRPRDLPLDTPSLARVEWEHIQRVLADCDGNISEAARALTMHRRSLQRKLAKHPTPR